MKKKSTNDIKLNKNILVPHIKVSYQCNIQNIITIEFIFV